MNDAALSSSSLHSIFDEIFYVLSGPSLVEDGESNQHKGDDSHRIREKGFVHYSDIDERSLVETFFTD